MEEVRAEGLWFVPGHEDSPSYGTLTWTAGSSARVDLTSLLVGGPDDQHQGVPIPVVLGNTAEQGRFTLCGVHVANRSTHYPQRGLSKDSLEATAVMAGDHIPEGLERPFSLVSFRLNGLTEWWEVALPRHARLVDPQRAGFALEFEESAEVEIPLDGAVMALRQGVDEDHQGFTTKLTIQAYVELTLDQALPLREIWTRYMAPIHDLFGLLIGPDADIARVALADPEVRLPVQLLSRHIAADRAVSLGDVFAPLRDIRDSIASIVRVWTKTPAERLAARHLFLAWQRARPLFADQEFLLLVSALEAFHRAYVQPDDPSSAHMERLESVLANCPPKYRRWLTGKLRYSHEPTLEARLREIISQASVPLQIIAPTRATFAKDVADRRNVLAHNDPNRRHERELIPIWLNAANAVLMLIIKERLLMECGLKQDALTELARWHWTYHRAQQLSELYYEQLRTAQRGEP